MSMRKSIVLISLLGVSALWANNSGSYETSEWEQELLRTPQQFRQQSKSRAPKGDIQCVAEFEPMQGAVVSYRNSMDEVSEFGVPLELLKEISSDDTLYVIVNTGDKEKARGELSGAGASMDKVKFIEAKVNSYWTRDFAPWWIRSRDKVEIIDFFYNRPARPDDNKIPGVLAKEWGVNAHYMDMIHCGGNFMADGYGNGFSTDLVWTENSDYSMDSVDNIAREYLGIKRYHILEDPLQAYIKHIDCWGKLLAPDKILLADVPDNHENKELYNKTAQYFQSIRSPFGTPYKVFRVLSEGEPYTNSLILNSKVFVPLKGTNNDEAALAVYREAMPGYEVIGYENSENSWLSTDALHCRVKGVADWGMLVIGHRPLVDTVLVDPEEGTKVTATIDAISGKELLGDSLNVWYRYGKEGALEKAALMLSDEKYSAIIPFPGSEVSDTVYYFIRAVDGSGRNENVPYMGEEDPFMFVVKEKASSIIKDSYNLSTSLSVMQQDKMITISGVEIQSISMTNILGRKIQSVQVNKLSSKTTIDLQSIAKGVYILHVITKDGQSLQRVISTL